MATELGHLSLTQLQKLAHQSQQQQQQQHQQHQPNPSLTAGGGSWMWNTSRRPVEDDDSWEVRAFAEDTGNIMGTTWPPRSYTCTFCRREFRSAQALGGHMNVHRRDRARLRLSPPVSADPSSTSTSSSNLIFPSQELIAANRGICFLYPLSGTPSNIFTSTSMNMCMESPSTLLSITPYPTNNLMNSSFPSPVTNFSAGMTSIHPSSLFHYSSSSNDKAVEQPSVSIDNEKLNDDIHNTNNSNRIEEVEELDLELRLGTGPSSS